jgi:hypothetical protein
VSEDRLRALLRETPVPGTTEAEERGLRLVEEAFADRPRHRPRPSAPRLAIALAAGLALTALVLSPAGAAVGGWLDDALTRESRDRAPALTSLPGGGRLLVTAGSGAWVVQEDGSRRLIGDYEEVSWSPNGLFVGAASGNQLTAVEPGGEPRWSLTRGAEITGVRWSPDPGFRVAYRAGGELRVVGGDGTGDELLAPRVAPVAPAWRPGQRHVLAYWTPGGAVRVIDTDTGRLAFRVPPVGSDPVGLEWSGDGKRLLATFAGGARIYDRRGRSIGALTGRLTDAAFRPGGHEEIAVLLRRPSRVRPTSQVVLASPETPVKRLAPLFSAPGALTGLEWSPDGGRILVGWRDADSWLFIPPDAGRVRSVAGISATFAPGEAAGGSFPAIAGWCCADLP